MKKSEMKWKAWKTCSILCALISIKKVRRKIHAMALITGILVWSDWNMNMIDFEGVFSLAKLSQKHRLKWASYGVPELGSLIWGWWLLSIVAPIPFDCKCLFLYIFWIICLTVEPNGGPVQTMEFYVLCQWWFDQF